MTLPMKETYDLERFITAQDRGVYEQALSEMKSGKKVFHWMWFIFPQIKGLGSSAKNRYYSISSADEARAYLAHPILGRRLREITEVILELPGDDPKALLGTPDWMKLQSSMTLFDSISPDDIFSDVLTKYYRSTRDPRTVALLR